MTVTRARDTRTTAGEWLSAARKQAGLSQDGLASLVGTTKSSIGNYEQGRAMVPDRLAAPIARALGCDVAETRAALGLWTGAHEDERPSALEDAIRADTRLLPEAKSHLLNQVGLLLRIQSTEPSKTTPESLARELEQQVEQETSSPNRQAECRR